MTFVSALLIGVHALVAWVLIEAFVNIFHRLSRAIYVAWHYAAVVAAFGIVFASYQRFFDAGASAFAVAATGTGFVLVFELVVFRYLYSGERWFLNWSDWIMPMFLAASTIYAVMALW